MGGQEVVVDELARQFQTQGHDVVVCCPDHRDARSFDRTASYQVIRHPRFVSTRWLLSWYAHSFRKLHVRHRFDVVHCHSVYPSGYLALFNREKHPPVVAITSHGGDVRVDNPRFAKPGLMERHRKAVAQADALIAIGPFTEEGFLRLGATQDRIHRIGNGVHLHHAQPQASTTVHPALQHKRFHLFLGRLAHRKGVDVFLRAIAEAKRQGNTLTVAVGGDGEERAKLEHLAHELGIAGQVHFLGRVEGEKKQWLLQNARSIVMPTREWEALPMVLLEAYASGCPVISSDAPGLLGLVQQDTTGWVTPRENHLALAERLRYVDRLPDDRLIAMGLQAKEQARQYDWSHIGQQHLNLFESLRPAQLRHAA
jgi:teichuronic acid biosynthesis glycosyltransferase TuaC